MTDPTTSARHAALRAVPIEIRVCVGRAHPNLGEMMTLTRDTVLQLDRRMEDKVELYIGDRLIGEGELVEMEGDRAGQLAVRLTEMADTEIADA